MSTCRRTVSTVCALALLAVTGCATTAPSQQDSGEPAVDRVPTLLASVDLRLPVQDYLRSDEQAEQLARGRLALIRQCMIRFGVDYTVEQVSSRNYGPRSLTERRYGITDVALARQNGYGLGERDPGLLERPANPEIGPDGEAAMFGGGPSLVRGVEVPSGGCVGEVDRALDSSVPTGADPMLGHRLQFESFEMSKKDSRVRAVFAKWSSCMVEAGYHYPSPLAAAADPRFAVDPPTGEHVTAALTDIRCKEATNVIGVWFTVESAYQRREIDHNGDAFEGCRRAIAAQQSTATKALPAN